MLGRGFILILSSLCSHACILRQGCLGGGGGLEGIGGGGRRQNAQVLLFKHGWVLLFGGFLVGST